MKTVSNYRIQFPLYLFLLLIFIFSVLLAIIVPTVLDARRDAYETTKINNFRMISLALISFETDRKSLPEATYKDPKTGKPLYSWRFRVMPYIESSRMTMDWEKAWDHPANKDWKSVRGNFFYGNETYPDNESKETFQLNVQGITGPNTGFGDGKTSHSIEQLPPNLITIVELEKPGHHWMKPGDLHIDSLDKFEDKRGTCTKFGNPYHNGFCVAFADGEVWFLTKKTPFALLKKFLTISSAETLDRNEILGSKYCLRGSDGS